MTKVEKIKEIKDNNEDETDEEKIWKSETQYRRQLIGKLYGGK